MPGDVVTSIEYDNAIGFALQGGVDFALDDHWMINVDVKKLFLQTDVMINGGDVTADVSLDPWIPSLGLGYRF